MAVRAQVGPLLLAALVGACGETVAAGGTSSAATASEPPTPLATGAEPAGVGAPLPLPATIALEMVLPGPSRRHLSAGIHLDRGLPWEIVGCVMPDAAPCEETMDVELDETARGELVRAIDDIRAIPLCEPEGIFPDDRAYELTLTGLTRPLVGHLPGDASTMAARNQGPCRADARLAWWIVMHFEPAAAAVTSAVPPVPTLPMPSAPES